MSYHGLDAGVKAEIDAIISRLSGADKDRILGRLAWLVFGGVGDDDEDVIIPGRRMDAIDVLCVTEELQESFWPDEFPAGRRG